MQVSFEGEIPANEHIQRAFLVGAMESLLNARQHGKATQLHVAVLQNRKRNTVLFRFTNNGLQPADHVRAGGGLGLARAAAEEAQGAAHWFEQPEFTLEMELPLP